MSRRLAACAPLLLLAACASGPKKSASEPVAVPESGPVGRTTLPGTRKKSPYAAAQEDPGKRGHYTRGGLYAPHIADSAPDEPIDVDAIPEPDVVAEAPSKYGNRSPYEVLGKSYRVRDSAKGYDETGTASYYGNKFHGRRTSNLEVYDMYAFTAAHRTLPLPSFARVTNLDNGKSVVVRVNDRGPFHDGRLIDLSYAAAVKLGIHPRGTGRVEVTGLSAGENARQEYDAVASSNMPTVPATTMAAGSSRALPPGVRIATGRPAPIGAAAATTSAGTGSTMDTLVKALPIASANASERPPPTPAPAAGATAAPSTGSDLDWRFDMRQDGRAMSADEFDAWMKSRRARVATGKAGQPDPYGSAAPGTKPVPPPSKAASRKPVPAAETRVAAREADQAKPVAVARALGGKGVTLQVAAFGARANAERALTMLKGAGVAEARMLDGESAGKAIWRVRVGPVEDNRVAELSARVAGLGFGQPQVVRE